MSKGIFIVVLYFRVLSKKMTDLTNQFQNKVLRETILHRILFFSLLSVAMVLFSTQSQARELQGRLGLGYNAQFSNTTLTNGVPGISLKYGLTRAVSVAAIIGVSTGSPSNSVAALKFFSNIFYETNLNFYFMLAGGLVSANKNTGSEFIGGLGTEFFIPGLESVGFSFETGVSLTNITQEFIFKTLGVNILNAGMHFYF